jgi:hypothetical protein
MHFRWAVGLLLIAAVAFVGCDDDEAVGLGKPCDIRSGDMGPYIVGGEQGNPDCKSENCMSFLGNEYCTDNCAVDGDCPETMACVDMEPHGGTGIWCLLDEDAEQLQE